MATLTVSGSLDNQAFEGLLGRALATEAMTGADRDRVVVDLSTCTFIEAPAATMLCALTYHLADGQRDVQFLPPTREDVRRYFGYCGLERALSDGGVGALAGELKAVGQYALPVCRVAGERDVAVIGDFICESVAERLGASAAFAGWSRSVFDALCENIVIHAEAGVGGWAAAQVHRRGDGRVFVRIGVVDVGVGIPATMARRHPGLQGDSAALHCKAILKATQPGATGTSEGGGIGLTQVCQIVSDCNGTLHVRSLTGNVTIGIHPTTRRHVTHFPGTQLHVILVGQA